MLSVNVINTVKTLNNAVDQASEKYFSVSTDKATNPVNMMGASKLLMEWCLHQNSSEISVSSARFANVAFSNGSLLAGFNKRLQLGQPIVVPSNIKRYFVTPMSLEYCVFILLVR